MSITMHSASVPIFVRMLGNMSSWLDKAEAHAKARKFDPSVYMSSRLAPDMLPFTKQVQIACDSVKFCVARLAGDVAPVFEDNETTFDELRARLRKTADYAESIAASKIDGSENKDIAVPRRDGSMTMKGEMYLRTFAMPNFFFHVTTVYALLRHNGVELGKMDFLGALG